MYNLTDRIGGKVAIRLEGKYIALVHCAPDGTVFQRTKPKRLRLLGRWRVGADLVTHGALWGRLLEPAPCEWHLGARQRLALEALRQKPLAVGK